MNNPNLSDLENILKALNAKLHEEATKLQQKDAESKKCLEENKHLEAEIKSHQQKISSNKTLHDRLENEIRVIKHDQEKIHHEVMESQRKYTESLNKFKDLKIKH